jgi:hypothetical protein
MQQVQTSPALPLLRRPLIRTLLICTITALATIHLGLATPAPDRVAAPNADRQLPQIIEQYTADRKSLNATYTVHISPVRIARFEKFYNDELALLTALDFPSLTQEDKVDYLLLKTHVTDQLHQLAIEKSRVAAMQPLLPYAETIEAFVDGKRLMQRPDAEKDAAALSEMVKHIHESELQLDPKSSHEKINPVVANRAVIASLQLQQQLHTWFAQYDGYDPIFSWWVALPYKGADKAITDHIAFLKEKLIGIAPDDKTTIIGDPVGRDALMAELADNLHSRRTHRHRTNRVRLVHARDAQGVA